MKRRRQHLLPEQPVAHLVGGAAAWTWLALVGLGMGHHVVDVTVPAGGVAMTAFTAQRTYELAGTVVSADGTPVERASVDVVCLEEHAVGFGKGAVMATTQTEADGAFSLARLPWGAAEVVVNHPAWAPLSARVTVGTGAQPPLRLTLETGLSIAGTVLEADGSPASNIVVTASWPGGSYVGPHSEHSACSTAGGAFRIDGLLPGRYALEFKETRAGTGTVVLARRDGIPSGSDELLVVLLRCRVLDVRVTDTRGRPLPNAAVCCEPDVSWDGLSRNRAALPQTDASGARRIVVREGNPYTLAVYQPPYVLSCTLVDLRPGRAAQAVASPLKVTLVEGATLRGDIIPLPGEPPRAWNLSFLHVSSAAWRMWESEARLGGREQASDSSGHFEFTGLPPGLLRVEFPGKDNVPLMAERKVWLVAGATNSVRLECERPGAIAAALLSGPAGKSPGRPTFRFVNDEDWALRFKATADDQGRCLVSNVPPGRYEGCCLVAEDGRDERVWARTAVSAGSTARVTFDGRPGWAARRRVAGTLKRGGQPVGPGRIGLKSCADDAPAVPVEVGLDDLEVFRQNADVTTNGAFSACLGAPCRYAYWFDRPNAAAPGHGVTYTTWRGVVEAPPAGDMLAIDLPTNRLCGVVRDARGAPVAGAHVCLFAPDAVADEGGWGRTGGDGAFCLEDLRAGNYELRVTAEEHAVERLQVRVPNGTATVDVRLRAGFRLVVDLRAAGLPAEFAAAAVRALDEPEILASGWCGNPWPCELEPLLPPGRYRVYGCAWGHAVAEREVDLREDTTLRLDLEAGGRARVRVANAGGAVRGARVRVAGEPERLVYPDGLRLGGSRSTRDAFELMNLLVLIVRPTDAEGVTWIEGLRPGRYRLTVDGSTASAPVEVKALETAEVTIAP